MAQDKHSDYKMAAVGPYDIISVFKAFGLDCFNAGSQEEAVKIIEDLKKEENEPYAAIFVSEDLLNGLDPKTQEKLFKGALPAITTIPAFSGDNETGDGASVERLRRLAERAIGSDILK